MTTDPQDVAAEYNLLVEQATKQLEEYRQALAVELAQEKHLVPLVGEIKLEYATVQDGTVSVVYVYPDALHAYLTGPDAPEHITAMFQGGITLGDETSPVQPPQ